MVKSPTIPTPHDALFRALVSAPKSAAAVLRDHLPNDVTALLSSKPPKLLEGTFVDEALRGSQADALFEVELKSGGTAFVYTLLEHKSSAEADTPLQLAGYMLRIWSAHAQKRTGKLKSLPPIVPMIIYHGASEWTYPTGIADMIAGDEPALKYLPGSDFILRDIRQMPREDLSSDGPARATFMAMRGEADAYLEAMLDGIGPGGDDRSGDVDLIEIPVKIAEREDPIFAATRIGGEGSARDLDAVDGAGDR